jgi:hypothetical protein
LKKVNAFPPKKENTKIYAILGIVIILAGTFVICFSLNQLLYGLDRNSQNQPGSLLPARVTHWSGYLVSKNIQNLSEGVSSISASWVVPEVKASVNDTFSSIWIGVGGYGEKSLIQTGTEQHCEDGKIEYFAWYELLPDYIVRITEFDIQPGDAVSASIRLVNDNKNIWAITFDNYASGQHFEKTDITYYSSRASAEWVVERPLVKQSFSTLANFGNATLSRCTATINGVTGSTGNFTYTPVIMVDSTDKELTSLSSLSNDGSSFSVAYRELPIEPTNSTLTSATVFTQPYF